MKCDARARVRRVRVVLRKDARHGPPVARLGEPYARRPVPVDVPPLGDGARVRVTAELSADS
ncbi:hypothetical protein [Streptomyces sp. NPDC017940]|uniref:hypothetical protein n=1 Tax=Streptomyces sp. NPDC017940 TaxID=3365017 RepID=UPI0037B49C10